MSKRSVALVGVLILMVMIGSTVIGAYSAVAKALNDVESSNLFLPLIMNAINPQVEVPSGAVTYFNLETCPVGWSELTDAQGRAIVGLTEAGTLLATVKVPINWKCRPSRPAHCSMGSCCASSLLSACCSPRVSGELTPGPLNNPSSIAARDQRTVCPAP
jgi:hypothetical protein